MLNILFYVVFGVYGLCVLALIVMFIQARLKGIPLCVDYDDEYEESARARIKPTVNEELVKHYRALYDPRQSGKLK